MCPQRSARELLGYGSYAADVRYWQSKRGQGTLTSSSYPDVDVGTWKHRCVKNDVSDINQMVTMDVSWESVD